MYLGIDAGGTHTDAVVIEKGKILVAVKVPTRHDDLPGTVREALAALPPDLDRTRIGRVTLGTTLAVNAVVQGRIDPVGLALSAGPGMSPARFGIGDFVQVVDGGLDHRGVEVTPLDVDALKKAAARWRDAGVRAFAVAGKFSPRNPEHENAMAAVLESSGDCVCRGHLVSGQLNFPRRIASVYYNAAVWRLHNAFLDAVEQALGDAGIHAPVRLLKADGGAVPLGASRRRPVESILSGPAASVMGVMALCDTAGDGLLLDMGGTTTDIALYADGSPVVDRNGMVLGGRRTLVRSLAAVSVGVGGDSLLSVRDGAVLVGPRREGPARAFGGERPTLLDALNCLDGGTAGDAAASRQGVADVAREHGMDPIVLARTAARTAVDTVMAAARELLERVNAQPVYTLAALLEDRRVRPARAWLVGGPAALARPLLESALELPVIVPPRADVANAVGAALTLPTAGLELLADSGRGILRVPALDVERRIDRKYTLDEARAEALRLLREHLAAERYDGAAEAAVEVTEAALFATLDDRGRGGRDIRVSCQLVPGITERIAG